MKPVHMLRLDRGAFENAATACQGKQIAAVVMVVGEVRPDLAWYVADVQGIGPSLVRARLPIPEFVGDKSAFASAARAVAQFESGVFVGVPGACATPCFRAGGLWTEDQEDADLCDALVEIRAFDTTYISLATNDGAVAARIAATFAGSHGVIA